MCPRRRARAPLRLPRARALRARVRAIASTRPRLLLDPYAKAIAGTRRRGSDALLGYRVGDPAEDARRRTSATARPYVPQERGGRRRVRLGGRPPAAHAAGIAHGHLRGPRQGLHRAPSRRAARRSAAPTRASPAPRRGRPPDASSASPRSSCCPCTTRSPRSTSPTAASRTTGATTRSASSRRTRASPPSGARGAAGRRVQDDGEDAAPGGHRGHPRRGVQPHRGGQPPRPDALASAASTTPRTTASRPTIRAATWTTRAAATRST